MRRQGWGLRASHRVTLLLLAPPQACIHSLEEALVSCKRIGYPVMLKASWGGGGKGIRKARAPAPSLGSTLRVSWQCRALGHSWCLHAACGSAAHRPLGKDRLSICMSRLLG